MRVLSRASPRLTDEQWWTGWRFIAVMTVLASVPLLWPQTPPLVDVPGHIGRFRVELDLSSSPYLRRYFDFHWAVLGNLGTDLLILALHPIMGLEFGVKVLAI